LFNYIKTLIYNVYNPMNPPAPRTFGSSRKRKIPGPIGQLDTKPSTPFERFGASSSSSSSFHHQAPGDEDVVDVLSGDSQDAEPVLWNSEQWRAAWSVVGFPPVCGVVSGERPREQPSEARWAQAVAAAEETPLGTLAQRHWEAERSGTFLAVLASVTHHTDMDATVQLLDPTGEASAYLHRQATTKESCVGGGLWGKR